MKAVILAGGLGTRLRPLTNSIPKPIAYVANRPFLVHQIELLVKHGIKEIILVLHFMPQEIKRVIGDGREWGIRIHYVIEEFPLGTAGAVKNAEKYFDNEPLIIFNGDVLTDLNLSKMIDFHHQKKALVTLALTEVDDPTPYGLILTDKDDKVTRFIEKPNWDMVTAKTINAGTYIVDPKIFKDVPFGKEHSFERQLFPKLLETKQPMYGYVSSAYWIDIGNPAKYKEVHEAILRNEVSIKIFGTRLDGKFWIGKDTMPDPTVRFIGASLVGEKVRIGKDTEIKDYVVIGDATQIGQKCVLDRCIIWKDCRIGNYVKLTDCIIGANCVIEDNVVVEHGMVLAENSVLRRGTKFNA